MVESDDWVVEWARLYARMDEAERHAMLRLIRASLRRERRRIWRSYLPRIYTTPAPLRLPVLHAALSFACLSVLPHHPLAIPTALGVALVAIVYIQLLAYKLGYAMDRKR